MQIRIEEYDRSHIPAVRAFNARIVSVLGPEMSFPEDPDSIWLPRRGHPKLFHQPYVALENGEVRGGYLLKHQEFAVAGEVKPVGFLRLPISEGVADRNYAMMGSFLIRDALERQPLIYSLGMGSLDAPLAKMQKIMGWRQYPVPFYFKVVRGGAFARNISALRKSTGRRLLLDVAASTGAASLGASAWSLLRTASVPASIQIEKISGFGAWADEVWENCRTAYSFSAVRDADIANTLYPRGEDRFLCWKVSDGERILGWTVCLNTQMQGHKQFGNMKVATIVDGLALPSDADVVMAATTRELERLRPDMIISNQCHEAWGRALLGAGFRAGPSNFIFSASKRLAQALDPFESKVLAAHINRGDGDGPIHL
jgi:hypothetical protein